MWMAVFWDPVAGDYSADQDWFPGEDNGSLWEADLMRKAVVCFDGLSAMRAWMLQPKSSVPSPVLSPTDGLKNFMLAFMSAWCKRVRDGIMAHGPLLAHAVQCGDCLVRTANVGIDGGTSDFLVPKKRCEAWSNYSWQQHGADGLAGITRFLRLNGFWSAPVMPIAGLKTPAPVRTLMQINRGKLADTVPGAVWRGFRPPRGVEVYIPNETYENQYQWSINVGVPDEVEQCFRRPASCVNHIPGGSEVTYYMQSKSDWFRAFFPHEGTENPEVKWIHGRIPTGKQQWCADYAADISMGMGHINDFRFVHSRCTPCFQYQQALQRCQTHSVLTIIIDSMDTSKLVWPQYSFHKPKVMNKKLFLRILGIMKRVRKQYEDTHWNYKWHFATKWMGKDKSVPVPDLAPVKAGGFVDRFCRWKAMGRGRLCEGLAEEVKKKPAARNVAPPETSMQEFMTMTTARIAAPESPMPTSQTLKADEILLA